MKDSINTVVFHYPCQDGLASAWIAYHYYKINHSTIKLNLLPANYNNMTYDMKDENILFLDFCPTDNDIKLLFENNNKIFILDHHISSKERLSNVDYAIFDINKSGVGLTWEYFFATEPIPNHLAMIQDRDLWTWKIKDTEKFTQGLFFKCDSVETIDEKLIIFDNIHELDDIIKLGANIIINKKIRINNIIKEILKHNHFYTYNHYKVCIHNCFNDISSELGSALSSEICDLAVLWNYNHINEEYYISLRSTNKVDCAKLASELFNGGGHKNAAGGSSKVHPSTIFKLRESV